MPRKGYHPTTQHREKLRQAHIGKTHTDEWKKQHSERMSGDGNSFYNRHHSETTKEKLRQLNLGKVGPNKGKHMSNDTKNKIRGKKNRGWKGDSVGYGALHDYLRKYNPPPNSCQECSFITINLDLACITGIYNRDFKNYRYLCRPCHIKLDNIVTRNLEPYYFKKKN